jgi:phenylacetate-CoA ligase
LIEKYFDEDLRDLQFKSIEEIEKIQNTLFLKHIRYTAGSSPFYQRRFKEAGISVGDIRDIHDVIKLPFTTKSDLNENNDEFLAVAKEEIIDVCFTSATTGAKPTMLLQTEKDLRRLAFNEEIAFQTAGIKQEDTVLMCAAIGQCFMAGLAYFLGGVSVKAQMVRAGAVSPTQIWEWIKLTGCTCIVGVPSLMRKIADYAIKTGDSPSGSTVKKLFAIGEPLRDRQLNPLPQAARLEELWGAPILSTYASTEIATTFAECEEKRGGHVRPELILTEIVDENGKPSPKGEEGEVVVTPLGVEGMPLIRFKTGDISFLIESECACGRKTERLGPILGRKNQMLKYKGTTVFPNTLLSSIEGEGKIYGGYVEALKNPDGTDRVLMYISLNDKSFSKDQISNKIRAFARVVPEIKLIEKSELDTIIYPKGKRKRIQFIDKRSLKK